MSNQLFALTGQYINISQYPTLAAANTAAGSTFGLNIDRNVSLTGDLTLAPLNIVFSGGVIATSGHVLTINTSFQANPVQIFDVSTGGSVISSLTGVVPQVYLEWFGAKGDNTTDDLPSAQAAWNFATLVGATVIPQSKRYFFNGTLTKATGSDCASIIAEVSSSAFCTFKGNGSVPIIQINGTSGFVSKPIIKNIRFENAPTAIECRGQCGVVYDLLRFDTAAGVLLHNFASGSFTEDNVITQCEFTSTCVKPLEYKITSGNNSFHGSGFGPGALRNTVVPGVNMNVVTAAGFIYNAPLCVHVNNQANVAVTYVTSSASFVSPNFIGYITGEVTGTGTLTIADPAAQIVFFSGAISIQGKKPIFGRLVQPNVLARAASNTVENVFVPFQTAIIPGPSLFVLPELISDARRVCLQLFGGGYYKEYIVDILVNDLSGGGVANITVTGNYEDTPAWGATTIGVSSGGFITLTNANFPANTVRASWTAFGYGLNT